MSHILEEFAKSCNVKPAKPKLVEHFFPITFDKYIILGCSSKEQSMFYPYWQDVFDLIKFPLEINNFRTVQLIEGDCPPIPDVDLTLGMVSSQQKAYVMKKSSAFIGASGLLSHMASAYGIKSVSLHSKYFIQNNKPYWTENDICLEPERKQKPTFSSKDPSENIKKIKPEVIAQSVLDILGIDQNIVEKSIFTGKHYPNNVAEVCPDFFNPTMLNPKQALNIRLDWNHDLNIAANWIQGRKVNIFTEKELDINFVNALKNNINLINIFINDETKASYIKSIENTGVKFKIYAKNVKDLSETRLKFIDWIVEEYKPNTKKDLDNPDEICDNSHYKSSKIIVSNNQVFSSRAAMLNNIPQNEAAEKVIDCAELWEDLPHLYIFNK